MRCKQGELAFINKALRPENVGRVVTTSKYMGYFIAGEVIVDQVLLAHTTDHWWMIESESGSIQTEFGSTNLAYSPDTWLTPIKPQPLAENDEIYTDLLVELQNSSPVP